MITAYDDWMNHSCEQNNFQKYSGEFSRNEEMTRKVCFRAKICEQKTFHWENKFELLVPASNPLKHEKIEAFQVVLFCALHLFTDHFKHFEYGCKSIFYNPQYINCCTQVVTS